MESKINIFLDRAMKAISHQKYINAVENYHKASILARRIGNYKLSILCLLEMADIYFEKQNYETALQFYKDALEMAEGTNTLERRDEIIKMIIQIYDFWHRKEELFKYIKILGAEPPDLKHVDDIFTKSDNVQENIQIYDSLVKQHYGYYRDKFQIMKQMLESNEHIIYRFFGRSTSSVLGIAPKNGFFLITNKKFHVKVETFDEVRDLKLSIPYETISSMKKEHLTIQIIYTIYLKGIEKKVKINFTAFRGLGEPLQYHEKRINDIYKFLELQALEPSL